MSNDLIAEDEMAFVTASRKSARSSFRRTSDRLRDMCSGASQLKSFVIRLVMCRGSATEVREMFTACCRRLEASSGGYPWVLQ